jgi:hypothetical protein
MPSSCRPTLSPPFKAVQVAAKEIVQKQQSPTAQLPRHGIERKNAEKQNGLQRRLACVPGKTKAFKSPMFKSLAAVAGNAAQASPLSYMLFSSRLLVFVVLCCGFGLLVSFRASPSVGPVLEPG